MKNILIQFCMVLGLLASAPTAMSMTDSYFATGEDLDFLLETDSTFAIEEIEYKLRRFVLYRKLEDFLYGADEEYPETTD